MQSTRRILLAQIKYIKLQRPLACSAALRNEFEIKSPLGDIVLPNVRFLDRLWQDSSKFKNLVALVVVTDYICHGCWELINQNVEQLPEARVHSNICTACGRSILRSRSRTILRPEMSERETLMQHIIAEWIRPREESAETKKCYTYEKLFKHTAAFATSLHKSLGLKVGDVVAVMLPNSPEFAVVTFGSLQAGCVLTTLNPIYKEHEIQHQLTITQPKVFITTPSLYDTVVKGLKTAKVDAKIILVDNPNDTIPSGTHRLSEITEKVVADYSLLDKIERSDEDIAFIPFSSGTTGLPKGVEISYKNLKASIETMSNKQNCYPKLSEGSFQEIVPCILPFFHVYGLVVTLIGHLSKGCKLVTMSTFSATLYLNLLKQEKVTLLYVVPPIAILLGKHPDVTQEHFSDVRHIVCGAAPLAATDVDAIMEKAKTKLEVNQGYGSTETTSLTTATLIGQDKYDHDSCGEILAGVTVKFVDPTTGNPVPVGQKGEMYIKGSIVMKGYHKDEKSTRESITDDGFFKSGDLGYYKPGVGTYITDRIKELIKVKGLQVAPAELESVLRSHPAIQDAGVIGVPHEYFGEVPKAFVIVKKEFKISPEEIQEYVASKVAPFKKIEEVVLVDNIPKNLTGKILRRELRKMYV